MLMAFYRYTEKLTSAKERLLFPLFLTRQNLCDECVMTKDVFVGGNIGVRASKFLGVQRIFAQNVFVQLLPTVS